MWPTHLWSSFLIEKVWQLCEVVLCSTTSPPLLFCLPPLYQLSNDHQVSHLSKNCHNEKPTMCQTNLNLNWTLYTAEPEKSLVCSNHGCCWAIVVARNKKLRLLRNGWRPKWASIRVGGQLQLLSVVTLAGGGSHRPQVRLALAGGCLACSRPD